MIGQDHESTELIPTEVDEATATHGGNHLFPTILLAFGMLVLVITIARLLSRASSRRQARAEESPRETIARVRTDAISSREPLATMMAEASELSRNLAKVLDGKAARLELLIEQADERIAALREATERATPHHVANSSSDFDEQVGRLAEAGCDAIQIARALRCSIGEVELILALRQS